MESDQDGLAFRGGWALMGSPENKEAPNKSETHPSKDRTETARQIGRVAIDGSEKK
jgi:hypothetical protein